MSCADDLIIARLCKNKAHLVLRLKSDCNIKAPSDHGERVEGGEGQGEGGGGGGGALASGSSSSSWSWLSYSGQGTSPPWS